MKLWNPILSYEIRNMFQIREKIDLCGWGVSHGWCIWDERLWVRISYTTAFQKKIIFRVDICLFVLGLPLKSINNIVNYLVYRCSLYVFRSDFSGVSSSKTLYVLLLPIASAFGFSQMSFIWFVRGKVRTWLSLSLSLSLSLALFRHCTNITV